MSILSYSASCLSGLFPSWLEILRNGIQATSDSRASDKQRKSKRRSQRKRQSIGTGAPHPRPIDRESLSQSPSLHTGIACYLRISLALSLIYLETVMSSFESLGKVRGTATWLALLMSVDNSIPLFNSYYYYSISSDLVYLF